MKREEVTGVLERPFPARQARGCGNAAGDARSAGSAATGDPSPALHFTVKSLFEWK